MQIQRQNQAPTDLTSLIYDVLELILKFIVCIFAELTDYHENKTTF